MRHWGHEFDVCLSSLRNSTIGILTVFQLSRSVSWASLLTGIAQKREAPEFGFVVERLGRLAALRVEVDYILSDFEAVMSKVIHRALVHLQRTIIADDGSRSNWRAAFNRHGNPL